MIFYRGTKLIMEGKVHQAELKNKYFMEASPLVTDREVAIGGYFVTYCQLRPAKEDSAKFLQFMNYLVEKDAVSFCHSFH